MLPVTGLPPQVTIQSTPALVLSPDGIMLSFSVEATTSVLTFAVAPLESITEIGPAFAKEELLPQPEIVKPSTAMHRTLQKPPLASESDFRKPRAQRVNLNGNLRVSMVSMELSYLFLLRTEFS